MRAASSLLLGSATRETTETVYSWYTTVVDVLWAVAVLRIRSTGFGVPPSEYSAMQSFLCAGGLSLLSSSKLAYLLYSLGLLAQQTNRLLVPALSDAYM